MPWKLVEIDYDEQGFHGYFCDWVTESEAFRQVPEQVAKLVCRQRGTDEDRVEITTRAYLKATDLILRDKENA